MSNATQATDSKPTKAPAKKASAPKKGAAPKAAAAPKADKAPAKKAAAPKDGGIDASAKIKVLVKENPHRKGSLDAKRYAKLNSGMTVAAAREEDGMTSRYLKYAEGRGIISIG